MEERLGKMQPCWFEGGGQKPRNVSGQEKGPLLEPSGRNAALYFSIVGPVSAFSISGSIR